MANKMHDEQLDSKGMNLIVMSHSKNSFNLIIINAIPRALLCLVEKKVLSCYFLFRTDI